MDEPTRSKRFRHPKAIVDEMQRQINMCLKQGIIQPSESPYISRNLGGSEKSGKNGKKNLKMVTYFRQLNEITVGNSSLLALTVELVDPVANAEYTTAIELRYGFYQIPKLMQKKRHYPDPTDITSMFACGWASRTHLRLSKGS